MGWGGGGLEVDEDLGARTRILSGFRKIVFQKLRMVSEVSLVSHMFSVSDSGVGAGIVWCWICTLRLSVCWCWSPMCVWCPFHVGCRKCLWCRMSCWCRCRSCWCQHQNSRPQTQYHRCVGYVSGVGFVYGVRSASGVACVPNVAVLVSEPCLCRVFCVDARTPKRRVSHPTPDTITIVRHQKHIRHQTHYTELTPATDRWM